MERPCKPLKHTRYIITAEDTKSIGIWFPCDYHEVDSHKIFIPLPIAKEMLAEYGKELAEARAEEKKILAKKKKELAEKNILLAGSPEKVSDTDKLNLKKKLPERPEVHWQCHREGCGKMFFIVVDEFRRGIQGVDDGVSDGHIEWRDYD